MFYSPISAPTSMHIPDGFLSAGVSIALWLIAVAFIAVALRRVSAELGERQVPFMGVLAACIFAGQMLNFAVAGGTSGHLVGAALATILLGPWAAIIIITCVVGVQALIFQDGGLLALGANIVNMGIIGAMVTSFVYRTVRRLAGNARWGMLLGGFLSGWIAVELSALAVALELALSGTAPANVTIAAMGGVHALIGIGEGLITVGALSFITAARRDLLAQDSFAQKGTLGVWLGGLLIAVLLAVASPLASAHPDGLEWVAEQLGFDERAQSAPFQIIPDYVVPGVANEQLATILSGVIGLLIVLGVALLVGYLRRKRQTI
jgi:cobalt/nickel transport system permease protein